MHEDSCNKRGLEANLSLRDMDADDFRGDCDY